MARRFDDIRVDDQLEMPASHGAVIYGAGESFDPERTVKVAIVTHIWFDPVEAKEYVALAMLRRDGTYGKPNEKRTINGLACCGWRKANRDWIAQLKAVKESDSVVPMFGRRQ